MTLLVYSVVLSADILLLSAIIISIFFPKNRIWPPPKKDSWQQYVSWLLYTITMFGVPITGALDFESLGHNNWILFLLGGLAILFGSIIFVWGIRTLSTQQSLGAKGKIITQGPYRFTRNPQYLGFILFYIGIILVSYSLMTLITAALLILVFLILPFSEEPWLKQQYGEPYIDYCKNVPRFIGIRSFKQHYKK